MGQISQAESEGQGRNPCDYPEYNRLHFNKNLTVRVIKYGFKDFKNLRKVSLIVPPTGGTNLIDRQYAKHFCNRGLPAIILDQWTGSDVVFEPMDLKSHQKELDYGKKAFMSVVRFLSNAKIAVLSTSKGGIGMSCFLNEFPRNIKSLVTVVAGAPLHLTISRSNQEDLRNLRDIRMRSLQISNIEDYDKMIYSSLKSRTSPRNRHVRVAMIIGEKDFSVHSSLQHHLAELWRPDQIWTQQQNHVLTVIFSFGFLRSKIYQFMAESL